MKCLGSVLGIIIIALGVALALSILEDPSGSLFGDTIVSTVCGEGETLSVERNESDGTGLSNTFFCMDSESVVQAEVTDPVSTIAVFAFAGAFVVGLLFMIISAAARRSGSDQQPVVVSSTGPQVRIYQSETNLTEEQMAHVMQVSQQLGSLMQGFAAGFAKPSSGDLASRLQELQAAHQKGLLTDEEYQKVRQAILDAMDDNLT